MGKSEQRPIQKFLMKQKTYRNIQGISTKTYDNPLGLFGLDRKYQILFVLLPKLLLVSNGDDDSRLPISFPLPLPQSMQNKPF